MDTLFLSRQEGVGHPSTIKKLDRVNVVLHVSNIGTSRLRVGLGQSQRKRENISSCKTRTGNLPLRLFSVADCDSPFSHIRVVTPSDGKVRIVQVFVA
jgi:hypothetical protein